MRQIFNYHTHTYRCGHASLDSDESYVQSAIATGFKVLGMSDHAPYPDYSKTTDRMDFDQIDDYLNSMYYLKEKYKDQIDLKVGFEMEYFDCYADSYFDYLLSRSEYLLLGQHYPHPDGSHDYAHGTNTPELIEKYTDLVIKGMKTGKFLYLAHPDYFMPGVDEFDENCRIAAERIFQTAEQTNTPVEINIKLTKRRKQLYADGQWHYPYPFRDFWKVAENYDVKCLYGFDAHDSDILQREDMFTLADEILDGINLDFIKEPLI